MSFDLDSLGALVAEHGPVTRVVIADVAGSTPREIGASMVVWKTGQAGTIGGGTLEYDAAGIARATTVDRLDRYALGPSLGQCCGGSVTLVTETWDADRLTQIEGGIVARPLPGGEGERPLAVTRALARARDRGERIGPGIVAGWMVEPVTCPTRALWIYGAGHVGRAIVGVLAEMPEIKITWIDTSEERFPENTPQGVTELVAADPAQVVRFAPPHAEHLVLTYSHELDLEICHAVLLHAFGTAGLIGSATKWTRFRKRLHSLGHSHAQIDRIQCPIGDRALGKHPQAIAVGVAAGLLRAPATERSAKDAAG